jgi:threonine dehydrogenase-like Zn-dependent dehydrogenase
MQAVVCRKPGDIALEERPEATPSAGEAVIAVRRVGICGTDYHIFEGSHLYLRYPRVVGHELSGEVLESPRGSGLRRGERVLVNPYLSCGSCIACRKGKPNCCARIAVLGVHRDGGLCGRICVPEGNVYPAGNLTLGRTSGRELA